MIDYHDGSGVDDWTLREMQKKKELPKRKQEEHQRRREAKLAQEPIINPPDLEPPICDGALATGSAVQIKADEVW